MRIVVYTALIGNIDRLWSVMPGSDGVQHVAFVDAPKREAGLWGGQPPAPTPGTGHHSGPPTWEQRIVEPQWDNRRTARHYKTLPHRYLPDADVWIWVDANVRARIGPQDVVRRYATGDLATFDHWDRRCLYAEAAFCAAHGKDDRRVLEAQVGRYRAAGMPRDWGLAATRAVVRRNTESVRALNEAWWAEIECGSVRDQVSLPFVCWRAGLRWSVLPGACVPGNRSREWYYLRHRA